MTDDEYEVDLSDDENTEDHIRRYVDDENTEDHIRRDVDEQLIQGGGLGAEMVEREQALKTVDNYNVDLFTPDNTLSESEDESEDEPKIKIYDASSEYLQIQQSINQAERDAFERVSRSHNLLKNCFSHQKVEKSLTPALF